MKFVIYSPAYNDESGGPLVLHRLCDRLNHLGHEAYIFPMGWHHAYKNPLRKIRSIMGENFRKALGEKFTTCASFDTPIAGRKDIKDAIVVYPEVVTTNPLKANKVVRWLLYKTDYDRRTIDHFKHDLFFHFQEAFKIYGKELNCGGQLQVMHLRSDIYKMEESSVRSGSCYALRKGKDRKIVHSLENSKCIDELSHRDIAKIFNETEMFISYDPYTLFSQYAAMCGCISVVVPLEGKTRDEWQPMEELRLGVAYGFTDLAWAIETSQRVAPHLAEQERVRNQSVVSFVAECEAFFR